MLNEITPIIITFNEEANIRRTLAKLWWAKQILVVDSGSTDQTLVICADFANVRVIQHPFSSFAEQCNFALQQEIATPWVLSMDADYVLSSKLIKELEQLISKPGVNGYKIRFRYKINGALLRASLYPPRICLYRKDCAHYKQDGHAHKVAIKGIVISLQAPIYHDDQKSYARWITSQKNYAQKEAYKLGSSAFSQLGFADKCRRLKLGPLLIVPYLLFCKGLIFDGAIGREYLRQRLTAERLLQNELNKMSRQ